MLIADLPANEKERLRHLKKLSILDTLEEQAYDDLTLLAAQLCNTPIALISLIDEKRQWFKSRHGFGETQTARDISFCSHAILHNDLFIVEDTDQDERFRDNPLVNSGPNFKFYAGAPLVLEENIRIGTLCVLDTKKSMLSDAQKVALEALARQVVSLLMLRVKVKELKKIDDVKDQFLSMVSHELRTPLTSLKGSLDIMTHLGNESMETMLDIANRNTNQLLVIVNDILDLASMEAGNLKMNMAKLNVAALVQNAIGLSRSYTDQHNCAVSFHYSDELEHVEVFGDKTRLLQVLSNLIANAAKFAPNPGGEISLSLTRVKQIVKISVFDNGPGIADEFKDRIFTKFQQAETPKNQKLPGTGLGLAICKHIVEAHDGEIGFNSEPNHTTEFYFGLKVLV